MNGRVLYLFDHTDIGSRLPLARAAQEQGYEVIIGLIGLKPENAKIPKDFKVLELPKPKNKFSPFEILKTIKAIRAAVKEHSADLLHVVTLKYSFLAGLAILGAAPRAVIFTIAGLGFTFRSAGWKPKLLRIAISPLLKLALKGKNTWLVIQNADDRELLIKGGYVKDARAKLVVSSGVDTSRFKPTAEPQSDMPIALMVTRLVHEKGVHIFAKAAKALKEEGVQARFQIAGGITVHNPQAITQSEMETMVRESGVEWLGPVEDVPALLASSAVIVYPSYYGEGVPRVSLEAIAAGRPLITTDHTGCREPVIDGDNGILTPIKDVAATVNAMRKLLADKALREKMGTRARQIAEQHFDVNIINAQTLAVYEEALSA